MVAPTSVNGGRSSVTVRAPAPWPSTTGQAPLLHRRIERLLDRAAEAVDLVDEEDRPGLQRGQEGGDVCLSLQRRARGLHHRHAQLGGDDVRERGLAQPRRTGKQHVVERLAAAPGGLDEHLELRGDLRLVDEVGQSLRAKRAIEVLLAARQAGVGQALLGVVSSAASAGFPGLLDPGVARDAHVLAPLPSAARRSAAPISSSALSPSRPSSSRSASVSV